MGKHPGLTTNMAKVMVRLETTRVRLLVHRNGHDRFSGIGVAVEVLLMHVGWRGSQGEAIGAAS